MNLNTLNDLLCRWHLDSAQGFHKIDIGFTNDVYDLDNRWIVKVCADPENAAAFSREAYLYERFQTSLAVPAIVGYDMHPGDGGPPYIIYKKIEGVTLYECWHLLSDDIRERLVGELCEQLSRIRKIAVESLPVALFPAPGFTWREEIVNQITRLLGDARSKGICDEHEITAIQSFVDKHADSLDTAVRALVYWDAHFDNVIVENDHIVGLIDFERTTVKSIDYTLDIVRRMVQQPAKYMSPQVEPFARKEDYMHLLEWFGKVSPELFDFPRLDIRLDLYALEHDLRDLLLWPEVASIRVGILGIVQSPTEQS